MTRLQNAKKQLNDALAELESAISMVSSVLATPSKIEAQNLVRVNPTKLVDEVSSIEAKLNEAIAILTKIEADTITAPTAKSRAINDREAQ